MTAAPVVEVLTTPVTPIGVAEASSLVAVWTAEGHGRVVCAANVHMVMEAWDDPAFAEALAGADLVVADGRPVVWASRLQGASDARHTRGLDLMLETCRLAARCGLRVGLYGAEDEVREEVGRRLNDLWPDLEIVYSWSPPFRPLTQEEDDAAIAAIAASGTQVLLVSLGCPKQEWWMIRHRERLSCVSLGVGGAFDMLAGTVRVAPRWAQRLGVEWLYRLVAEPRRLWRRYARHNGRFVVLALRQVLEQRLRG